MREEGGQTRRLRAESFADHYSQARQFFISQTEVEQRAHRRRLRLRAGQGARTRRSAPGCWATSATSTRTSPQASPTSSRMPLPEAAEAAVPTRTDLPESPALSILLNGPESFAGRKLGVLVTDGSDKALVKRARVGVRGRRRGRGVRRPGRSGRVKLKGGGTLTPDHAIDGGPSVLFDAVALLPVRRRRRRPRRPGERPGLRQRRLRPPQVRRLGADAAALLDAAGVEPGRRLRGPHGRRRRGRLPGAVRGAAALGAARPGLTDASACAGRASHGDTAPRVCLPALAWWLRRWLGVQPIPWRQP